MNSPSPASLSVDMKKNRLRVHKAMLHQLSDPAYIQLLVNPDAKMVAIKAIQNASSSDQAHRVPKQALLSDSSVEIYSQSFIFKLKEVTPGLDYGTTYRMSGYVYPKTGIAIFSLKTITKVLDQGN